MYHIYYREKFDDQYMATENLEAVIDLIQRIQLLGGKGEACIVQIIEGTDYTDYFVERYGFSKGSSTCTS